ncbi:MAG TPA: CFI-box-CTERM domain-containing protein [Candidatus Angelobacter sp.]
MDAPKPANLRPFRNGVPASGVAPNHSNVAAGVQRAFARPSLPVADSHRMSAAFMNQRAHAAATVCQRATAPAGGAPPVYRPNASQINLKSGTSSRMPSGSPPVYRPMNASAILRHSGSPLGAAAPPVYRPNMAAPISPAMNRLPPGAPPVYRPVTAIQRHSALPGTMSPLAYKPNAVAVNALPQPVPPRSSAAVQPRSVPGIPARHIPVAHGHAFPPIQRFPAAGLRMPVQPRMGAWSVIQRDIPEDVQQIRNALAANPPHSLRAILEEILDVYGWRNVETVYGRSGYQSEVNIEGTHGVDRRYQVVIDERQVTDDTQRQSYIVHELMHASVDERYEINRRLNEKTLNAVYDSSAPEVVAGQQFRHGRDLAGALAGLVEQEREVLGGALADHLISRLDRIQGANTQEFDTVISELYYYVWRRGVSPQTATYREIVRLAEAAAASRHHQAPITGVGPTTFAPVRSGGGCGCCVITTACVESRGLPDDCEELTVLRQFRDQYISRQEDGEAMVGLYYQVAPEIVAAIQACPDAAERFDRLFGVIQLCVAMVKDGRLEDALAIYQSMVVKLKQQYLDQPYRDDLQTYPADNFMNELLAPAI